MANSTPKQYPEFLSMVTCIVAVKPPDKPLGSLATKVRSW
jgi:hypothetical protein